MTTTNQPAGQGPARGVAGRQGDDVRSDLWVAIEPRAAGGLALELESKVAPYYGEALGAQIEALLGRLGATRARVEVKDYGALPFVISARVEAAARRAGIHGGDARPERTVSLLPESPRDRLRRSRLYVPGSEPKFMVNSGLYGADGIIFDLEDSVHVDEKDGARLIVRNALRTLDLGAAERMVRVNQLPLGLADLDEIIPESPDVILIPKVESAEQVVAVDRRIAAIQARHATTRRVWLMPILESALGIENAFAIASSSPAVCALTIGLEDYTADLGVVKTAAGAESLYARLRLVNAARAALVQPIDSVYGDVADTPGLAAWARRSCGLGFVGMGCVHPRQVPVVHEAFAPSAPEIEKARAIVAAFEDATRRGLAVVSLGSKMIDPPVVLRARKLVAEARAMGLLPEAPARAEEAR